MSDSLSHLHRAVQSRQGQDALLLFSGETSRVFAQVFAPSLLKLPVLQKLAFLSAWAKSISPVMARLSNGMQTLTALLEEWQMMNRMFGLLDVLIGARDLLRRVLQRSREKLEIDWRETTLDALQHFSMICFHLCEGAACLASKKVLNISPKRQEGLAYSSIRFWAAFTFLDLARGLVQYQQMKDEWEKPSSNGELANKLAESKQQWRAQLINNLAWAPVTLHWSVKGGLLPDSLASLLAVIATAGIFKDVWRQNA